MARNPVIKNGSVVISKKAGTRNSLTLTIAGDFCVQYRASRMILADRSQDILSPIQPVLTGSDLFMLNLECPLTRKTEGIEKSGPNIKSDPKCIGFLKTAGVGIANLANNHIGDYGTRAALDTIRILNNHRIKNVGAGASIKDARRPLIFTKKGIRFAVLSYAENEFGLAEENKAGGSPLDPIENCRQIRAVSEKADITLVLVHGGNEYNPIPSPRVVKTYRAFIDSGAQAVIGNHTHCPQGVEVYNRCPIVYSLGNFLFDRPEKKGKPRMPNHFWMTGYLVKLTLDKKGARQVETIPYTFKPQAETIRPLTGKTRDAFLKYLDHISRVIPNEQERLKYWHGWCALQGPQWVWYLKDINETYKKKSKKTMWRNLMVRNAFTCEAHNELLTTYMKLVGDRRVQIAKKYIPKIKKLMRGKLP